ncbi:MAG TPA: efflux transporter outer membrane subunit [Vicinamibacterales bacterium]|jgi:NodT family efflux transporter outer membrane factor (OMF) lipoprotein|nr:efflux transporter outer membrane subunit [Vicinamibacterales bacterium]
MMIATSSVRLLARRVSIAVVLAVSACAVGPKYVRPAVEIPPAFKEVVPDTAPSADGWKPAQPGDNVTRGAWWMLFNDPTLNGLEVQLNAGNQSIAAAMEAFMAARALTRQARSQFYPTVTVDPSITATRQPIPGGATPGSTGSAPSGASGSSSVSGTLSEFVLPFDASWAPDLWGRVSNTVKANAYSAQASAADLENVRLTLQAELAVDYFELRAQDTLKQLFDETVAAYRDSLDITRVQLRAGIASDEVVAQAETQLEATEAQDTNLEVARAQSEHAIALLLGQPASTFSLPPQVTNLSPPPIPVGLPAQLLERRPDVAAAERRVAQANAQIGIASAAFFPNVTLSASGGFESTSFLSWLSWPARFWSAGPALAQTLFDAGLRRATVQQYQAIFNQVVATYRQTVLGAFQQVEDSLAAIRIVAREIQQQDTAVESARRNLRLATARYRAGIDPYLNVITAQTTLLINQQTAVALRRQQMTSSVQLVEALGGGWSVSDLPTPHNVAAPVP